VSLSNEDVQDILALLDSLPYDDLTLETSRFSLRLRRSGDGVWARETQVLTEPVLAETDSPAPDPTATPDPAGPHPADPDQAGPDQAGPGQAGPAGGQLEIRAPLLGTFYRAPQPGAAPFVDIGSTVTGDTVVAIIETMKLMNPVYAGVSGTVTEICLADGEFAAQDTVLMRARAEAG
jgi:acetyl-CoA carboxylase biotin carboxyl carrier protein